MLHLNLFFRFIKQSNLLHIIYNHLLTNLPSKVFPIYSQSEFENPERNSQVNLMDILIIY